MRKKSISLIIALTFLLSLFPMALPAMAADYSRLGGVNSVKEGEIAALSKVEIELSAYEVDPGDEVIISLPSDFIFSTSLTEKVYQPNWTASTRNSITRGSDGTAFGAVTILDDNEIKLTAPSDASKKDDIIITLGAVYVDEDYDGDIPLKFKAPGGSGFSSGEVVVGRVTDGEVLVEVVDEETFGDDGGEVTIRFEEDRAGAFEKETDSVKLILPDGFEWGTISGVKTIFGDDIYDASDFSGSGDDELVFDATSSSSRTAPIIIEFTAKIDVADETEAKLGDIVAKVKGESDVTPSTIIVGSYGDYTLDITASDPTTVYAGQLEQEIADITIEESIDNSLVDNRSITLTLPDWAKWGALPDAGEVKDGAVELDAISFPGKDATIAKYTIKNEGKNSAAELEFEDLEVVLSPDAPEGDLEVVIGGTATQDVTIKVAEVKKPVAVSVDTSPTIVIGKAGQALGTITITEADAGLINEGKDLVLSLPKDVEWDDYEVEVTEGDLEIGKVDDDETDLTIDIDDESNEASTIKITGTVTAYRTVPEGKVDLKVKGPAVIEVNDEDEVAGTGSDGYYKLKVVSGDTIEDVLYIDGIDDVIAIDDYDKEDGLFEDATSIAKVEAAYVGTPAPGDQKINAVFTLGSTTFTLNGEEQTMDVAPYAKNGRTYLPMRYVAKALGIKDSGILWKAGTATFISANKVVSVKLGSTTMTLNGAPVPMDVAPEIVSGRTMIPIKWIATAFDVNVTWDAATQQVTVN